MHSLDPQAEATSRGLMVVVAALMTVGVVMASSTGVTLDGSILEAGWWHGPLGRQMVFAILACSIMLIASRVDVSLLGWRAGWLRLPWGSRPGRPQGRVSVPPPLFLLIMSILLLAAVWMPYVGHASHGRRRWIDLGVIGFQPSEFAKIAVVVFLAAILSTDTGRTKKAGAHLPILGLGVVCILVGLEDFGTAALLALVGGLMLVVGGCRLATLAIWALPAVAVFAGLLFSQPYRVTRLLAFRHIWEDRLVTGYHAIQSLAAIASGGWTGRGLGAGMAQYGYLPEARSDFVFAVICEQMGFIGGTGVVLLFVAFVYCGMRTMQTASSGDGGFVRLFAFGVTAMIGFQALMNIAVVTVVAPTKGIGLPFVSAGGSGMLCLGMAAGLLAGVARRGQTVPPVQACEWAVAKRGVCHAEPGEAFRPGPRVGEILRCAQNDVAAETTVVVGGG